MQEGQVAAANPSGSAEGLSKGDLALMHNALNEVCNGLYFEDSEFATRLGASRSEAEALLEKTAKLLKD